MAAYVAEGRKPAVRFRMPDRTITFDDLVRGEISFDSEHVPDFVMVRANGHPLYTLVNPVDDAMMEITHVLRGEDLLSSTPRQIALYDALADIGVGTGRTPRFGHLPYVMGQGNKKLSKRDPESNLLVYRERGFLPEGLLNYLALLGWAIADDHDIFTHGRDGRGVHDRAGQPQPGPLRPEEVRGDQRHAPAGAVDARSSLRGWCPTSQAAGLIGAEPTDEQRRLLLAAAAADPGADGHPRRGRRHARLPVRADGDFAIDPDDAAKLLERRGRRDRAGRARRAGRPSTAGTRRRSRRRCAPR